MTYMPTEEEQKMIKWVPRVDAVHSIEFSLNLDSTNYVRGESGWRLSPNGDAEFGNIVVRGVIQSMGTQRRAASVAGGKLMISAGTILTQDLTATATKIYVRDYCFEENDIVRIYTDAFHDEYLRIVSKHTVEVITDPVKIIGEFKYSVERNIGSGIGEACAFEKGDVVAVWVRTDAGGVVIDADDPYGPFMDVLQRTGEDPDDVVTRVRVGNLNGIDDPAFEPVGGVSGYGLYGDNVFLKGKFVISSDSTGPFGDPLTYDSTGWQDWRHNDDITLIDGGVIYTGTIVVGALAFDATGWTLWRHPNDVTLIDGGDIYTGSVTADKITVAQLDALSANMGTLTAGEIKAQSGNAYIHLDAANRRLDIHDENGVLRVRLGDLS